MPESKTNMTSRPPQPVVKRETPFSAGPFRMLERFADEIDSVFDNFGLRGITPRAFRGLHGQFWNPES